MTLEEIQIPISNELKMLNNRMKEATSTNVALLNVITQYIIRTKGKQMRPTIVYLMSLLAGKITEATHTAAIMIELLHTATLVHDDVVDSSNRRRGFFSINAIWKNKIAVLVGDYLLSRGLLVALKSKQYDILDLVSESVKEMSEGELLQIEKARKLDITEEVYYEIIFKKTASLLKSACAAGVLAGGGSLEQVEWAKEIGLKIGMAFQIQDDLLDLSHYNTGKPKAHDIKDQKMTLPLIYTLSEASFLEKQKIKWIIKYKNKNEKDVKYVVDKIYEKGGLEYAKKIMLKHSDDAKELLQKFPNSLAKENLNALINLLIHRKK